jgi:hypothetical protein
MSANNKQNESKEQNTSAPTAPIISTSSVKTAIMANVALLEMKQGKEASCSAEQYGAILFMSMADLGVLPREGLDGAMAIWDSFPKSPSAFRQVLEKEEKGATSAAASSIMAKLLAAKTPQA